MPEGPEIRLAADKVARVLVDNRVETVGFGLPRLKRFEKRLSGNIVTAVDTRGKAMLTRFDNGLTIYSHNQLYGRWYTVRRPRMPRTYRQLRIELRTQTHKALLYSASDIEVLDEDQLHRHPFLSRVGPDILDRRLNQSQIVERLCDSAFRNRSLGSLYLDFHFLSQAEQVFNEGINALAGRGDELAILHHRKGAVLSEKKDYAAAVKEFRIALEMKPNMEDAMFSLGWSYSYVNPENAKIWLNKFVQSASQKTRADYLGAAQARLAEIENGTPYM